MKKSAFIGFAYLFLAMTCLVFSQNKKGNLLIGTDLGSAGLYIGNSESSYAGSSSVGKSDYTNFGLSVYPTIGYYFTDNLVVGTYFALEFYIEKYNGSSTGSSDTSVSKYNDIYFSFGPFGRFYFGKDNKKGRPFVHVSAGISFYPIYSYTYTPSSGSGYTQKYDTYFPWNVGIKIGYEHYLNPTIGLEYYIGYAYYHYKSSTTYDYATGTDYTYNSTSHDHDIQFGVGLQIHLDTLAKKK
jgi:hypothetical protein